MAAGSAVVAFWSGRSSRRRNWAERVVREVEKAERRQWSTNGIWNLVRRSHHPYDDCCSTSIDRFPLEWLKSFTVVLPSFQPKQLLAVACLLYSFVLSFVVPTFCIAQVCLSVALQNGLRSVIEVFVSVHVGSGNLTVRRELGGSVIRLLPHHASPWDMDMGFIPYHALSMQGTTCIISHSKPIKICLLYLS